MIPICFPHKFFNSCICGGKKNSSTSTDAKKKND